ncbi:MAG: hypothetical protein ACLR4Z_13380 [Butyricicoccaceae bacterium]
MVRPTARRQEDRTPPHYRQRQPFIVPSLHPKQESDKTAVEAPPDVIAADTAMEELTECPALPASAEDEAAGWDWDKTNIDEFEEEQ